MADAGASLLIVDDEPEICWVLEQLLHQSHYRTRRASNGQEAIRLVSGEHFSMAFLDAKLPDIEGLELARRICRIDPSVCLVLVSAYYYHDDPGVQQALAEGLLHGFVSKPFLHQEILDAVGAHLSRRDPVRE